MIDLHESAREIDECVAAHGAAARLNGCGT